MEAKEKKDYLNAYPYLLEAVKLGSIEAIPY